MLEAREAELTARWERALEAAQVGCASCCCTCFNHVCVLFWGTGSLCCNALRRRPPLTLALQGERATLQQALDLANRQLAAAHRDMETLRLQVRPSLCMSL